MTAAALVLLPKSLTLAGKRQVILRPQQDEVIDHRRLGLKGGQLDRQVLGFCRATAEKKTDADFPGLAVLAGPVADADGAVSGVVAECPFADDMLEPPGSDFYAMLQANLQKSAQARLQFPG